MVEVFVLKKRQRTRKKLNEVLNSSQLEDEWSSCTEKVTTEETKELKLFKIYVDDIVSAVKGNPLDYLEYANSLHDNFQFTLETPNASGDRYS